LSTARVHSVPTSAIVAVSTRRPSVSSIAVTRTCMIAVSVSTMNSSPQLTAASDAVGTTVRVDSPSCEMITGRSIVGAAVGWTLWTWPHPSQRTVCAPAPDARTAWTTGSVGLHRGQATSC
jgi:hypothetical protein